MARLNGFSTKFLYHFSAAKNYFTFLESDDLFRHAHWMPQGLEICKRLAISVPF